MNTNGLRRRVATLGKSKDESPLVIVVTKGMSDADAQAAIDAERRRLTARGSNAMLIVIDR